MKEFFALKILDLFKGIYIKVGVNYDLMRLIIKSKLLMDSRRVSNLNYSENEKKPKKETNHFYASLIIYLIVGLFTAPIIAMDIAPIVKMTSYLGIFMIIILTIFISDFSTVILDVNDKEILYTKGVDLKTLNAAKVTHIFIYISLLSLSISFGALALSLKYGIGFFLLFLISIFLIDILMIIVTAIMYLIILKLFKGEKLKDMINIVQIGFLLMFTFGYQFIARAFDIMDFSYVYSSKVWNILIPPMWFGSNFNILQGEEINSILIILSLLSIVVPIISIILYIKLIPVFEENLHKLSDNTYNKKKNKESLTNKVSKLICRNKEDRIFFIFVNDILSKDRDFKMKAYPSLAMAMFMPIFMIISAYDGTGMKSFLMEMKQSSFFFTAYMFVIMVTNIITMTRYSNEYEASWIYEILPINNKKYIYTGMFKAILYRFISPIFLVISIVFIMIFGIRVIKHLILIYLSTILISMFIFKVNKKELPFSTKYQVSNSGFSIITMIQSVLFIGIMAAIHAGINMMNLTLVIWIYACTLVIAIRLFWNKTFKI